VTPTVVCPPLTDWNATSEVATLVCATSVAPAASVRFSAKPAWRVVTPAMRGCPALNVPRVKPKSRKFVE
jgi:hypothetical protein